MRPEDGQILAALYDGVIDDAQLQQALTLLAKRFHSMSAALISLDAATPQASVMASIGVFGDPKVVRAHQEEFSRIDPAPQAFASLRSGGVSSTDRLFDRDQVKDCAFLHEFYLPLGLRETLGGNLGSTNGHFALIGIHRGADRGPFETHEIDTLEQFTPHLTRALQLRRSFAKVDLKFQSLAQAIDRLTMGVVVLDGNGQEIHVNIAAREIAACADGLSFDRNGVPHATGEAEQELARLCADVRSGGAGGLLRVPRKDDAQPYAILVAPLPSSELTPRANGAPPCTLILISDPSARFATAPERIAAIFGLPLGTARLVAALADGEDPKSYAERNRVTVDAVKFHLKTAFARTGLRSQSRLLQAVVRVLTELGERRQR